MRWLVLIPALFLLACKPEGAQITCPSAHQHPPAFWRQVEAELDRIMALNPEAIMVLLDENRVNEDAIRICIRSLKKSAKKNWQFGMSWGISPE